MPLGPYPMTVEQYVHDEIRHHEKATSVSPHLFGNIFITKSSISNLESILCFLRYTKSDFRAHALTRAYQSDFRISREDASQPVCSDIAAANDEYTTVLELKCKK